MESRLAPLLQELRAALEALYGDRLVHLILYGSQARGEATADSDIDVMVVLSGTVHSWSEIDRMNVAVTDLCLKYDELISLYPISEKAYRSGQEPVLKKVYQEGTLL